MGTEGAVILCVLGFFIGLGKAGLAGSGSFAIPLLALAFGARESTGIVLPMLLLADIIAVLRYNRHADWKKVTRVMPWVLLGILGGVVVGEAISDRMFGRILGGAVLIGVAMLIRLGGEGPPEGVDSGWPPVLLGVVGGLATMVGNAGGPILTLYLMRMGLPKFRFIGTRAWFFFIINCFKIPFHVVIWRTISFETLSVSLVPAPAILAGAYSGVWLAKRIPETPYRLVVVALTGLSAAILLFC